MSETELSVVCKSCGAEVSPYVTECPYCGARLRKRAPDLERRDGALEPKLSRKERRREKKRKARLRQRERIATRVSAMETPVGLSWATLALLAVPAAALVARIAIGATLTDFGALTVPFAGEWWRFLAAPFIYGSIGYAFVTGLALVIFAPAIERRLGTVPTVLMLAACGILGALAAFGIENALGGTGMITGGNGIALGAITAWYFTVRPEARSTGEAVDVGGVLVCSAVILLLPVVIDGVSVWAGIAGAVVGGLSALVAARFRK